MIPRGQVRKVTIAISMTDLNGTSFGKPVEDLDIPFYLYPVNFTGVQHDQLWADQKFLIDPPQSLANDVAISLLGLVTNRICNRFPKLQAIVRHPGDT